MSKDDQYKKTLRLIIWSFLSVLFILMAIAAYFSIQLTNVQNNIRNQKVTIVKEQSGESTTIVGPIGDVGPRGFRGFDGEKGDQGVQGTPGQNGLDGVSIQGEKGDKGDMGQTGTSGREIELCYMMESMALGQRYVGDTDCRPILTQQLPTESEEIVWSR